MTNRALNVLSAQRETASLEDHEIASFDDPAQTLERRERLRARRGC